MLHSRLLSIFFIAFLFGGIFLLNSCKKDVFDTNASTKLEFSLDTVYFDTVFTTIGSVTKRFKVYNPSNDKIKISNIKLAGGNNSPFRLNIDGMASNSVSEVEIDGKDSIFVFTEVTIDPNNELNPFVVLDSVLFETNGNLQNVKLMAYGRNADFYRPTNYPTNGFPSYSIVECNTTWTKDRPKVIIGYLVVDSACTLTIEAGTQVYLYNNSGLWVYKEGKLLVNGTLQDSVVFQGVRKEEDYNNIPGQWDRIWINQGSTGNLINYAVIKNGNIGIQAEDVLQFGEGLPRQLTLSNTRIKNMKAFGLYGVHFNINAWNNVISNCGSYAMALINGGTYRFRHNTIANYWSEEVRTEPAVFLSNYQATSTTIYVSEMNFSFSNGIVYGNLQNNNELDVSSQTGAAFNWSFDNSVLKVANENINTGDASHFSNMVFNSDPLFRDNAGQDYRLSESSSARNKGNANVVNESPSVEIDLLGNNRLSDSAPDCGAMEFTP
jgi:hypothetical protein